MIAKRFIQYLCYRKNVFFSKVELSTSYKGYKHIKSGELYVLEDLEEHNSEEEVLKKGCYIRQSYITGAVGSILQSIAEDSIYVIKKNCLINVKISCLTIQLESC